MQDKIISGLSLTADQIEQIHCIFAQKANLRIFNVRNHSGQ